MTVGELVRALQEFDSEKTVVFERNIFSNDVWEEVSYVGIIKKSYIIKGSKKADDNVNCVLLSGPRK